MVSDLEDFLNEVSGDDEDDVDDADDVAAPEFARNVFNLVIAKLRVSCDKLAKQTLNQPGSVQWQDEPGEMLSLTRYTISFHSSISASNVFDFKRCLMSTQQNNPALLFRQLIPIFLSPETRTL